MGGLPCASTLRAAALSEAEESVVPTAIHAHARTQALAVVIFMLEALI
jgi:hypothetical protein